MNWAKGFVIVNLMLLGILLMTGVFLASYTPPSQPISGEIIISTTPKPTGVATVRPTARPTPDPRCIITIDNNRYNVTDFRNMHSGGDIFACGTDMSSIFHQQHSQRFLDFMQQYRI